MVPRNFINYTLSVECVAAGEAIKSIEKERLLAYVAALFRIDHNTLVRLLGSTVLQMLDFIIDQAKLLFK